MKADELKMIRDAVPDGKFIIKGVMSAEDAIDAVKIGADSVLCGRLVIWGLLIDSTDGVMHMFRRLEGEIRRTMVLMRLKSLKDLKPCHLVPLDEKGERILKKVL